MQNTEIKLLKPFNKKIEKYVEFYYDYELDNEEYYAFPSAKNVVVLFNQAKITYKDNSIYIEKNKKAKKHFYGLNKYTKPLLVKTKGKVKEFVIVFKPYGLAQFMKIKVDNLSFFKIDEFNTIVKNEPNFFNLSLEEKVNKIEAYLLSILNEKQNLNTVIKSISLMDDEELNIETIAEKCNCGYKKLYRLFKLHCGATPTIIKKNIRFRNALKRMKNKDLNYNLSDIALDLGYYDQAFFNKAFKQLTNETPGNFFKVVNLYNKGNMYFKNIENKKVQ